MSGIAMAEPELDPSPSRSRARPPRRHALLVVAVAVAVYSNTLTFGFVWDDHHSVLDSVAIRSLSNVPAMFTTDVWSGGTRDVEPAPYYRPLLQTSLAIDRALWGETPFGYHLTNVLLHALASLLVWAVARRILANDAGALAATLLFAVHPIHTESVAWISARGDMICAALALESFRRHLRYADEGRSRDLALSLLAFLLSLLAKEMSVALPAMVFAYELSLGAAGLRRALGRASSFLAVVFAYLLLRAAMLEVTNWGGSPLPHRILTSFGIVAEYLRLLILPAGQKVFYDLPVQTRLLAPGVLLPALALAGVAAASVLAWHRDRRLSFGVVWTVLMLAPVSGIPAELAPALMAERHLYLPSVGFALAVGALVAALARRGAAPGASPHLARPLAIGGAVVLLGLGGATVARSSVWRDDEALARAWIDEAPNDVGGHLWLASVHGAAGRLVEAEREYLEAIRLRPDSVEAHTNLANLFDETGRRAEAEGHYLAALTLAPRNPEVLYNLAVHRLRGGDYDGAEALLRSVVELNPASCDAHYNLGLIQLAHGDRARAIEHLQAAARIDPRDPRFREALSGALRSPTGEPPTSAPSPRP